MRSWSAVASAEIGSSGCTATALVRPHRVRTDRAFSEAGVCDVVEAADNAVLPGIERVTGLIRSTVFVAFDNLPHFKDEIARYSWRVSNDGKPVKTGQPVKVNDHLMDAMRYALMDRKGETDEGRYGFNKPPSASWAATTSIRPRCTRTGTGSRSRSHHCGCWMRC